MNGYELMGNDGVFFLARNEDGTYFVARHNNNDSYSVIFQFKPSFRPSKELERK